MENLKELEPTLRKFKARGWVVTDSFIETREAILKLGKYVYVLKVMFYRLAPPTKSVEHAERRLVFTEEGVVLPIFSGYGNPGLKVEGWSRGTVLEAMDEFASKSPKLSLPFWAEMCGKCAGQGGDWMFGACLCGKMWRKFVDGIPDDCPYSAEQVMSRAERVGIMVRLFEGYPISQRMLRRRI